MFGTYPVGSERSGSKSELADDAHVPAADPPFRDMCTWRTWSNSHVMLHRRIYQSGCHGNGFFDRTTAELHCRRHARSADPHHKYEWSARARQGSWGGMEAPLPCCRPGDTIECGKPRFCRFGGAGLARASSARSFGRATGGALGLLWRIWRKIFCHEFSASFVSMGNPVIKARSISLTDCDESQRVGSSFPLGPSQVLRRWLSARGWT